MATIAPGTYETTTIDGTRYVALRTWARDIIGLCKSDERHVCTRARAGATTDEHGAQHAVNVAGARTTFGGLWVIPVDTGADVIPQRTGGAIVRRADGRVRFAIYLTDVEHAAIVAAGTYDVVDLRVKRAERRAKKRADADAANAPNDADADADAS